MVFLSRVNILNDVRLFIVCDKYVTLYILTATCVANMSHYSYTYEQFLYWLTVEIPNLCTYVYILRIHPPVALAHPPSNMRICVYI